MNVYFWSIVACVFQVGLQNRYKLNKKYRKYLAQTANSEGGFMEDDIMLKQHKVHELKTIVVVCKFTYYKFYMSTVCIFRILFMVVLFQ
jgi:hypothetical protein